MVPLKLSEQINSKLIDLQTKMLKSGLATTLNTNEKEGKFEEHDRCGHCSETCVGACTSSCYGGFIQ